MNRTLAPALESGGGAGRDYLKRFIVLGKASRPVAGQRGEDQTLPQHDHFPVMLSMGLWKWTVIGRLLDGKKASAGGRLRPEETKSVAEQFPVTFLPFQPAMMLTVFYPGANRPDTLK